MNRSRTPRRARIPAGRAGRLTGYLPLCMQLLNCRQNRHALRRAPIMTTNTHSDELRAWAKGSYPTEAAVEMLLRAFRGRFAAGEPWIVPTDFDDRWMIDVDEMTDDNLAGLSGGNSGCCASSGRSPEENPSTSTTTFLVWTAASCSSCSPRSHTQPAATNTAAR